MAATQPQQQDDDEDDIAADPTKILLPHSPQSHHLQNGSSHSPPRNGTVDQPLDQRHYLPSIPSTILIRQLPSQGLSFQLWPAATSLVALLDHHRRVSATCPLSPIISAFSRGPRPLRILELGSGTGLVGIAAALTLGAAVTVTDLPHVVPNLQFNADANAGELALHGGTLRVEPLRWGEEADVEGIGRDFDLVLASDVVYHDHLYDPLIKTLHLLLCGDKEKKEEQEMVFVMAHLKRWKKEAAFFNRARKLFDVDVIHVDKPCEGSRVGVTVYRFTRKGQRLAQKKC